MNGGIALLCTSGDQLTELEFVKRLLACRSVECVGPAIKLAVAAPYLGVLEESLRNREVWNYIIANYLDDGEELIFVLCVRHWLMVAMVIWNNGVREDNPGWRGLSEIVLQTVCRGAQMDPKEIANLIVWCGVSLT